MAMTTADLHAQLPIKQAQAEAETPSLEKRKLARLLNSTICYHRKDFFYAQLELGADINFYGLDDLNKFVNLPLINAIFFDNIWAFDELLRRGAEVNKVQIDPEGQRLCPLFIAIQMGNLYMVEKLLEHKANPLGYFGGTYLPLLLETIHTKALLECRWRYENQSLDADNVTLKKGISDFVCQEGRYEPPKPSAVIPFVVPEQVIHVHYEGKLEILGLMLAQHVSPTIPVSGTDRSALSIVQNPVKYFSHFRADPKEALEYIGTETEKPHVLLFKMTLINKRNTATLGTKIVVHYDLEPARFLIEGALVYSPQVHAVTQTFSAKVEEDLQAKSNELKQKLEKAQAETARLQAQLAAAQTETKHLADTVNGVGEAVKKVDAAVKDVDVATKKVDQAVQDVGKAVHFEERQEIARFTALIDTNPNAKEAYKSFKTGLEAIHTSAQAVLGGLVTVSEGPCSLVASALGMSTELVDMIPVIGSATSKLFGLASAAAKELDKRRQTNLSENIAVMVTAKEARKTFEVVARKLTMAYLRQFERLATKENAQAYMSRTQQSLQHAKSKALKSRFKSPAEQVTAFAIIWMMDEVFNKTDRLDQEMAEKGLEALLLTAVTQHKPEERLMTSWNEITSKLDINAIPIQNAAGVVVSGATWDPADFWTAPGVMIRDDQGVQYFAGAHTNVPKFGWRSGSLEDVEALGLIPTTETAALAQNGRVLPQSPKMIHAYDSMPPSSVCQPESYEKKVDDKAKPDLLAPSKRTKSPFAGFKIPGFRRGCPAPIATS